MCKHCVLRSLSTRVPLQDRQRAEARRAVEKQQLRLQHADRNRAGADRLSGSSGSATTADPTATDPTDAGAAEEQQDRKRQAAKGKTSVVWKYFGKPYKDNDGFSWVACTLCADDAPDLSYCGTTRCATF